MTAWRELKPEEVSPREAAAFGVDEPAWRALSDAEKKELAYMCLRRWVEDDP